MTSSIKQVQDLLQQVNTALYAIEWGKAQCADVELGEHLAELEKHISHAKARAGAVAVRARKVNTVAVAAENKRCASMEAWSYGGSEAGKAGAL